MEDTTITLTQAELDAKVEEAVANATKNLTAEHNKVMYELRKENKELKNANLSQEERTKKELEEKELALGEELKDLRAFKKTTILNERLAKENLPSYFKNDNRLLTADDGDIDKVIKDIKREYEASLPKGNTHTNIIQQGGTIAPTTGKSEADIATEKMGEFLNEILK